MEELTLASFVKMEEEICDTVISQQEYLCKLDSYVGDGDHGVTAARGFRAVREMLHTQEHKTIAQVLSRSAELLMQTMGGAIGPIFGSIFSGMADVAEGKNVLACSDICAMLRRGLDQAQLTGGAKEGDRTLIDALSPAVRQLEQDVQKGETLPAALKNASQAADQGVENTKQMTARKGRAKFLGEKSKGYQDAGATTLSIVLRAMVDYCAKS